MQAPSWRVILMGIALFGVGSGCISYHETIYREEPKTAVRFQDAETAKLFDDTLRGSRFRNRYSESSLNVSLPFVFEHSSSVKQGDNLMFNHAVAEADTNRDRIISDTEAQIFSDRF